MTELSPDQVRALSEASGLPIDATDLAEVTHRLNAFLAVLRSLSAVSSDGVGSLP